MANLPMSMAMEIGKARAAKGGNWLQHGYYTLMVTKWFFQKVQDSCIICELVVIEAKRNPVKQGSQIVDDDPNPVGSLVSEVANFDGPGKQSARGNARAVAIGLYGLRDTEVDDDEVTQLMTKVVKDDPGTPAAGMLLHVHTTAQEKRTKPGEFITKRNWECISVPGQGVNTEELARARMAALAKGPDEAVRLAAQHLASFRNGSTVAAPAPALSAAPPIPSAPPAIPAPSKPWLVGWTIHPADSNYFYNAAGEVKTEADLKAAFGS